MSFLQYLFGPSVPRLKATKNIEGLIKALNCHAATFASAKKLATVRAEAAQALGELKEPHAVEPLIAALKDSNGDVRGAATEAL